MAFNRGFGIGVMVGIAAGLILAPKRGGVTRRWAKMRGARALKDARHRLDRMVHTE